MRERIQNILTKAMHIMLENNQGVVVDIGEQSVVVCKIKDEETEKWHLKIFDNEDEELSHGDKITLKD